MVKVSFDLAEKIVKILDELVANSGGKTESEVLQEIIKRDMQSDTSDFMKERIHLPLDKREDLF